VLISIGAFNPFLNVSKSHPFRQGDIGHTELLREHLQNFAKVRNRWEIIQDFESAYLVFNVLLGIAPVSHNRSKALSAARYSKCKEKLAARGIPALLSMETILRSAKDDTNVQTPIEVVAESCTDPTISFTDPTPDPACNEQEQSAVDEPVNSATEAGAGVDHSEDAYEDMVQ
jgi:hypothetical protein